MLKWAQRVSPHPQSRQTDSTYARMNVISLDVLRGNRLEGTTPRGDIPGGPQRGRGRGRGGLGRQSQGGARGARGRGAT